MKKARFLFLAGLVILSLSTFKGDLNKPSSKKNAQSENLQVSNLRLERVGDKKPGVHIVVSFAFRP